MRTSSGAGVASFGSSLVASATCEESQRQHPCRRRQQEEGKTHLALRKHSIRLPLLGKLLRLCLRLELLGLLALALLLGLLLETTSLSLLRLLLLLVLDKLFLLLENLETLLVRGRVGRDLEFGFIDLREFK